MKRWLKALLAVSLLGVLLVPSNAGAFENTNELGPSWALPNDSELGQHVLDFLDIYAEPSSEMLSMNIPVRQEVNPLCYSVLDEKCLNGFFYNAILPICNYDASINCISDFGIVDSNGTRDGETGVDRN